MNSVTKLVVFYHTDEIKTKDVDKEIYTEDQKKFHIFFFHNIDINRNKSIFLEEVISNEFQKIKPKFRYDKKAKTLTMIKKLDIEDLSRFDTVAEVEYNKYLENLNYRIKCILDTFSLFSKLYDDKTIILFVPNEIFKKFISHLDEKKYKYNLLDKNNDQISYYDIYYWANYYSRTTADNIEDGKIKDKNITKILEILD